MNTTISRLDGFLREQDMRRRARRIPSPRPAMTDALYVSVDLRKGGGDEIQIFTERRKFP